MSLTREELRMLRGTPCPQCGHMFTEHDEIGCRGRLRKICGCAFDAAEAIAGTIEQIVMMSARPDAPDAPSTAPQSDAGGAEVPIEGREAERPSEGRWVATGWLGPIRPAGPDERIAHPADHGDEHRALRRWWEFWL